MLGRELVQTILQNHAENMEVQINVISDSDAITVCEIADTGVQYQEPENDAKQLDLPLDDNGEATEDDTSSEIAPIFYIEIN